MSSQPWTPNTLRGEAGSPHCLYAISRSDASRRTAALVARAAARRCVVAVQGRHTHPGEVSAIHRVCCQPPCTSSGTILLGRLSFPNQGMLSLDPIFPALTVHVLRAGGSGARIQHTLPVHSMSKRQLHCRHRQLHTQQRVRHMHAYATRAASFVQVLESPQ